MTELKKHDPDLGNNLIVTMTFEFAISIVKFSELLRNQKSFIQDYIFI